MSTGNPPAVVSRKEWLAARKELLAKGEGTDLASYPGQRRAAPAADGPNRQAIRVRGPGRGSHPAGPV
jgi:hypothetical protein